ncbi:MAG: glycosyltransferase family 2 protein [Halomonas sp.]|uniref:glycosyltransferase family 2 protein n=1 Tax=unclassified Halomonas TaxID=2609666 RepID=UPI003FBA27B6
MKVSLIITTYNWPDALKLVLLSAIHQSYENYEVIVADDGSEPTTKTTIENIQKLSHTPIIHAWHKDKGFRAAAIRNRAVAKSSGDYIIFIDGDCILHSHFISDHVALSEKGFFVPGSRVKLKKAYSEKTLNSQQPFTILTRASIVKLWFLGKVKRIHPIIQLPAAKFRYKRPKRWQGAVTCNLGLWREDFLSVNGFNNDFIGWGLEDSDLIVRLINNGTYRKDGKLNSFIIHLFHQETSRENESINRKKFELSIQHNIKITPFGFFQIENIE